MAPVPIHRYSGLPRKLIEHHEVQHAWHIYNPQFQPPPIYFLGPPLAADGHVDYHQNLMHNFQQAHKEHV